MKLYHFGPIFFQCFDVNPKTPVYHTAPITEMDPPYRYGTAHIVRYRKDRALFFALCFRKHPDEDTALLHGVQGYKHDILDDDGKLQERFLESVAEQSDDLDEEWEIVDALRLLEGDR